MLGWTAVGIKGMYPNAREETMNETAMLEQIHLEHIEHEGQPLAFLIRKDYAPAKTEFLTPSEAFQQIGMIVYNGGQSITPHIHTPIERHVIGTPETLIVRSGRMEVTLYSADRQVVAVRELKAGDTILLISGGHGISMIEDTVLLEVKQGPYAGNRDKVRFEGTASDTGQ